MMARAKTLVATTLAAAVIGCGSSASAPAPVPGSTGATTTATNQMSGYVPYEPMTADPSSASASTAISCATSSLTTTTQPTALSVDRASTGVFSVSMVDVPNPAVKEIWVTVLSVSVHVAGQGWTDLSDFRPDGLPVDLLKLKAAAMALGFASLPAGSTVTQIRLLIKTDVSTASGAGDQMINKVMLDEGGPEYVPYPLKTPSGYESGVKIMGPWTIQGCTKTEVTIDFDGTQSIWYHPTGRDTDPYGTEWILRPVIRVKGVVTGPTACTAPETGGTTPVFPPPGTITPIPPPASPVPPGSVQNGGSCTAAIDCSSGTCTDSVCVAPPGSVAVGGSCLIGPECSSGSCTGGVCVATGTGTGTGSSGGVPNGSACTVGTECSSGTCTSSVCTPPTSSVAAGGSCWIGPECSSGSCIGSKCAAGGAGTTCRVGAECLSNDCYQTSCTVSPVDGKCNKDSDCTTGAVCGGGTCVVPPATLAPNGSGCTQGTECMSNQCYVGAGSVWPTCQPGIQGAACDTTSGCSTGLFCDTSTCSSTGAGTCQPLPILKMPQ